jgi:hypothetical protein
VPRGAGAGLTAELRPIEPGDRERLRRFHARLSDDTVYHRYHGPHAWLAEGELDFLCDADGRRHIAWVACDEAAGFRRVDALILSSNGNARHLFASVAAERGIPATEELEAGVVELHLHLAA